MEHFKKNHLCEYEDVCSGTEHKCFYNNIYECNLWHYLKLDDLEKVFNGRVDGHKNYLLDF